MKKIDPWLTVALMLGALSAVIWVLIEYFTRASFGAKNILLLLIVLIVFGIITIVREDIIKK